MHPTILDGGIGQELVRRARERAGRGRIAGTLPPLDGDYRPERRLEPAAARAEYDRLVEAQASGVDLFLCETLPSIEEAAIATRAARASGLPVWTSVTVSETDGTRLRSGESLAAAARAALGEGAEAVLANCSPPEAISDAARTLSDTVTKFGVYANGFVSVAALREGARVDSLDSRAELGPEDYARFARDWVRQGASVVGPAHIAALAGPVRG